MHDPAPLPEAETKSASSLVPPVLLHPTAFLWLWVLPIGILCLLNFQGYWLIEGNMDPAQRNKALLFGLSGVVNLFFGVVLYGASLWHCRSAGETHARHFAWGIPAVVVQAAYLWFAVSSVEGGILPRSVTAWIYPEERFVFNQFAFAMLPLFAGILRIAGARPALRSGRAMVFNLGFAIGAPVLLYGLFTVLRVFQSAHRMEGTIMATMVIVLGVLMFVALVRALLLALRKTEHWQANGERVAIVVLALLLPVGGLMLNRTIPFPVDFQAWEVYALVLANTGILLLASCQHVRRPRLSFCLLCATFPFSLYFFIVFLPYTPLSILAIIALGTGFLVLSPTLLFTLHLHLLHKARRNSAAGSARIRLTFAGLGCCLILPAFFTIRGLADKAALNAALDFVYAPVIRAEDIRYPANLSNLRRAIDSHRSYKNGLYYPLLSDYYSWLVFDNLILPDDKLARLEKNFFGDTSAPAGRDPFRSRGSFWGGRTPRERSRMPRATPVPRTVEINNLNVRTKAVGDKETVVTLALTLANTGQTAAEYLASLSLPAGIYVNGFRLHIDGHPVPGRIFEKKTALWVYTMIRDSERRDPGLLYYVKPDLIELRVFPVNQQQPAVVEIDFLVPVALTAESLANRSNDPAAVLRQLGAVLTPQLTVDTRGNAFAAGVAALSLPTVEREPYLHVIVDRSLANGYRGDLSAALRILREKFPAARRGRVTLANFDVVDLVALLTPLGEVPSCNEKDLERRLPLAGGFELDLALAHAIRTHRAADLDQPSTGRQIPPRPIFVLLSRQAVSHPLDLEVCAAWTDLLHDLEIHEMGENGTMIAHRQPDETKVPLLRLGNSIRPLAANGSARFKAEGAINELEFWSPESSGWRPLANVVHQSESDVWSRAVELHGKQQDFSRSPGEEGAISLRSLVAASRESGVLVAATSYIVVENSAQWNMLGLSERKKLGQNATLDFLEAPAPPAFFVVLGFGVWFGFRRWRKSRSQLMAA